MSSSQQWAGLSKPQSSRKSSGRHRGQKLPGTPFFQVDPVVSLDRIDHPKPKVARRRSRKTSSKENRQQAANTLSTGAEFSTVSTSEGEKLSTDLRTEKTETATFGESSVSYASDDQNTQQFLANARLDQQPDGDDTVLGQSITYVSGEDAVVGTCVDDEFQSGLSLTYSSTLNCKIHEDSAALDWSTSYPGYDSSLCQFPKDKLGQFVEVPIPEKYPTLPGSLPPSNNLMQPLLTSSESDREPDNDGEMSRSNWGFWSCLFCCFPQRLTSYWSSQSST